MNLPSNPNRPPDITPVSYDELREWELGMRSLTPEQLVGALALQKQLYEQPMKLLSAV
jgi:hypothetical protein